MLSKLFLLTIEISSATTSYKISKASNSIGNEKIYFEKE